MILLFLLDFIYLYTSMLKDYFFFQSINNNEMLFSKNDNISRGRNIEINGFQKLINSIPSPIYSIQMLNDVCMKLIIYFYLLINPVKRSYNS